MDIHMILRRHMELKSGLVRSEKRMFHLLHFHPCRDTIHPTDGHMIPPIPIGRNDTQHAAIVVAAEHPPTATFSEFN